MPGARVHVNGVQLTRDGDTTTREGQEPTAGLTAAATAGNERNRKSSRNYQQNETEEAFTEEITDGYTSRTFPGGKMGYSCPPEKLRRCPQPCEAVEGTGVSGAGGAGNGSFQSVEEDALALASGEGFGGSSVGFGNLEEAGVALTAGCRVVFGRRHFFRCDAVPRGKGVVSKRESWYP